MKFLWILFLSIPLLASFVLAIVLLFAMVENEWDIRLYLVAIFFGLISAYLFRLLKMAFKPDGGLILVAPAFVANFPDLIVKLAARYRLPAIYPIRRFVDKGGLISYGPHILNAMTATTRSPG